MKNTYIIWVLKYYKECTYKGKYKILKGHMKEKYQRTNVNVSLDISYGDIPSIIINWYYNGYFY